MSSLIRTRRSGTPVHLVRKTTSLEDRHRPRQVRQVDMIDKDDVKDTKDLIVDHQHQHQDQQWLV
jgi:hypothetical protein